MSTSKRKSFPARVDNKIGVARTDVEDQTAARGDESEFF